MDDQLHGSKNFKSFTDEKLVKAVKAEDTASENYLPKDCYKLERMP